ncbi:LysR family transcriptional regulator [Flavobacterium cyanobacteriorum]|uniref:LysR family transcriptional regulator n=1 Tax=Flavobacterium cyanobacteriorum TaxID=2022802 RepID=A0A255YU90_9FLAO|nr:LysR family transcriptional regulator [Flavobacterium cyanobacteriorum]OYQ32234.1 LysR family transcriptional regulator [Flavobacterium cyanobacteriorum]
MNYTLNQLQIFLKIAKTQSVTKAAEELHLTQPAVSIQLRNFQSQFSIPLTEVVGRKIYITDFGKEIAIAAEKILEEVANINHKTLSYRGEMSGRLKISVVSTGKYIMPYFISGFIKNNPGVELYIDVTNKTSVLASLENNEVDFSLVSIVPNNLNIEKLDLLQNRLYLVGNTEEKFNEGAHSIDIFSNLPLIFRETGSGTRQAMNKFIEANNIKVLKKMELTSNEALKQAILAGMGYSIMPLIGLKSELIDHQLQIIPVKGLPIKSMWSLIWLKGKKHSPLAEKYLEYLKKEKEALVQKHFEWYELY